MQAAISLSPATIAGERCLGWKETLVHVVFKLSAPWRIAVAPVDSPSMAPPALEILRSHQRSATRYPLRLPVIFYWEQEGQHAGGGFTRDVALDGAFILSSTCPPVGAEVRVEVLLPSPRETDGELRVDCVGIVTRIEAGNLRSGFGVRGQFDDDHLTRCVPE